MLIKLVLTKKSGGLLWPFSVSSDTYILNPNRVKELKTVNTTGSQFTYMFDPEGDNADYAVLTSTATVASIVSAADDSPNSSFLALNVYEDDDTTEDSVTTYIGIDDIAFCADAPGNASWVWISQGGNRVKRLLVYHDLDAIINLADTGTTTTWLMS